MSNIFLTIENLPNIGDATAAAFTQQIQCEAMQHGIDLPVVPTASSRLEGSSVHSCVTVAHQIDKASPQLRESVARGQDLGKVVITRTRKTSDVHEAAEIITLGGASLRRLSMHTPLNDQGDGFADFPVEVIGFKYDTIQWDFKQFVDGGTVSTISQTYDTTT